MKDSNLMGFDFCLVKAAGGGRLWGAEDDFLALFFAILRAGVRGLWRLLMSAMIGDDE